MVLYVSTLVPGRIVYFGAGWDRAHEKRRPGVVAEVASGLVTVVKGTSRLVHPESVPSVIVTDFESVGLRKVTAFLPSCTFRIPPSDILRTGRMLPQSQVEAVLTAWEEWKASIQVGSVVWYTFGGDMSTHLGVVVDRRRQYLTVRRTRFNAVGVPVTDLESARIKPGNVVTNQKVQLGYENVELAGGRLGDRDLQAVLAQN